MNKIHKKRLLKLAEHLEKGKLIHDRFDFSVLNGNEVTEDSPWGGARTPKPYTCGTLGCALGEMPAVSSKWNFDKQAIPHLRGSRKDAFESAQEWFGLQGYEEVDGGEDEHLFAPDSQYPNLYGGKELGNDATAKEVAANIRAFIKKKEKDDAKR